MVDTIYLDLDGVLFDWLGAAARLCKVDLKNPSVRKFLKDGKLDDMVGESVMWDKVHAEGESFWANLQLLPWAKELYQVLCKVPNTKLYFCTSPSSIAECASGKHKALARHFGIQKNLIILNHKYLLAKPTSLLIDDTFKQIDNFRAYGGQSFAWPNSLKLHDEDISLKHTFGLLNKVLS